MKYDMTDNDMTFPYGRSLFLTGASSGIGRTCAKVLAKSGYTVYAASRNPKTNYEFHGGDGEILTVKMDVTNPHSVEEAIKNVFEDDIGIVIHCAGIGIACPAEHFPDEAISRLMNTNFTSVMNINSHILPYFRKRGTGLCIIVSSVAGLFPIPFQSHYCSSKAALEAYAGALRMEVSDYKIKVCLVLPGDTKTGFTSARSYEFDESSPYYNACVKSISKMEQDELSGKPPLSVAMVIRELCERKNPPLRTVVGFKYKVLTFMRRILPARLIEFILKRIYM